VTLQSEVEQTPITNGRTLNRSQSSQYEKPATLNLAAYGAMSFPLAFAGLPIYLHAPDFYAVNFGQSLAALGAVLLALRLFDAFQDPVIGYLGDKFHAYCRHVLIFGVLMLALGFWMLFHPLSQFPLAWFALSILVCTTGFSVVSINFQTLGGLWRIREEDRTKVTASREAIGLVGLLIASVTPAFLAGLGGSAAAFHWMTLGYLPILGIATWLLFHWMGSASLRLQSRAQKSPLKNSWRKLLSHRWRQIFFGLFFLNTFASAIPAVLVLFFIRDRLGAESFTGLFLLIYFLSGALSMPIWTRFARRFGKVRAWEISLAAAIFTFSWAAFLQQGDIVEYALICAFSGMALGADLALPPAILADHIADDQCERDASRLFSIMAFLSKSALAIATGLALPLLGILGYHPNAGADVNLSYVLTLIYAGLPCVFKLGALCGLFYFEKNLVTTASAV
jgi:GPH family glycoside/pentoside/hexuronide:cation symporter